MGKRKTIQKMARVLLMEGEYEQKIALAKVIDARHFDRDVLLLIGIFKDDVGKRDIMGEYYLLCVIKENATKPMAKAIAELLLLPGTYVRHHRSIRNDLLEILGSIGDYQTAQTIRDFIPLFERIEYPKEPDMDSPDVLRMSDMREIEGAIRRIESREGCYEVVVE